MVTRSQDWLKQAIRDLQHAEDSQKTGRHEWACFASQQAAEKTVRALHLFLGQEAWGHVVAFLLRELPENIEVSQAILEKAQVLDNFYIPTRYANGHPSGESLRTRFVGGSLMKPRNIADFIGSGILGHMLVVIGALAVI